MHRKVSGQSKQCEHELRRQLVDEARRLRLLATAVRSRVTRPELEEYVQSGRGPAYQRDYEAWMKSTQAAYAYEEAASRLEQALGSSPACA